MATVREIQEARRKAADSPVAWFVMLQSAIDRGDTEGERQARSELKRLGVVINSPSRGTTE
jgi:hypothetical protein